MAVLLPKFTVGNPLKANAKPVLKLSPTTGYLHMAVRVTFGATVNVAVPVLSKVAK